jgi:hypothetical protein
MNTQEINKFIDDVKDALTKAIGTSSSINEERDERSVENYVRDGGNTMENTTEPDPQGDIAVTKVISGATAPAGDQSVTDAPEGPVPTNETFPAEGAAIAPTSEDLAVADTVNIAKAGTCSECGQTLPAEKVEKAASSDEVTEELEKADSCADCGKPMNLCNCMGKAVEAKETPADEAKETPAEEAAEAKAGTEEPLKKSLWGGAFSAPLIPKL